MKKRVRTHYLWYSLGLLLPLGLLLLGTFLPLQASPTEGVVVLANSRDRDSVKLAEHYLEERGIPSENLVSLPMTTAETISWDTFWEEIFNPLQEALLEDGWINGRVREGTRENGRANHQVQGHRMTFLVTSLGVPLRIRHDPELVTEQDRQRFPEPQRTNQAAVDQVLALLAVNEFPLTGPLPNPFFQNPNPSEDILRSVIRVSRLDGPTLRTAQGLVDRALYGEKHGLRGRSYIDLTGGRPHPKGDEWLEKAAEHLAAEHFDQTIDRERRIFAPLDRFDAAAWYFGWYTQNMSGPFELAGFEFAPGAIGFHIHSFSATTVRSRERGWVGPLVGKGITATVGNVFEPYLEISHRPDLLVEGLLEHGMSFGEAAWYAMPALAWQGISIGDPLYQPMTFSLEQQLAAEDPGIVFYQQYAVIREMNRLRAEESDENAIAFARQAFPETSGVALGYAIAQLLQEEEVAGFLAFLRYGSFVVDRELGLLREVAQFLEDRGAEGEALSIYEKLISRVDLSPALRRELLEEGISKARAAPRYDLVNRWEAILYSLEERE